MPDESIAAPKFKAIARIGGGGMADIYLTEVAGPSGFRKLAVVKRIRPQDADEEEMVRMFLDEARLAARLNHPNIVNTFEVGSDQDGHFIAMEYLEGQPLDRILRRANEKTPFPLSLQLHVLTQALSALQYAHELRDYDQTPLGIVHRDVTPHNIFVLYSGQSKLVDFGIAKSAGALGQTRAGAIKGKFAYMAPEQARSEKVDARTDLFTVGLVLWEALTKRRVWAGMNESQILHALLSETPIQRPSEIASGLPSELEAVCMKAVSLEPSDRFASAADFQIALEDAMNAVGMRVSTRDIGRALDNIFAVDRARLRDEVEAYIRRPADAEMLPVLAFDAAPGSESIRQTRASFSQSQGRPEPPPAKGSMARAAGIGVVLAAALALVTIYVRRSRAPAAPPPVATIVATATATAPPFAAPVETANEAPEPRAIRVEVSVLPATAELFLDGVPVSNPFRTRRPADGSVHVFRAVASGYAPETRRIHFKEDVLVDVALSPLPNYVKFLARPTPKAAGPAAAPAPASSSVASPTSSAPPSAEAPSQKARALDDPLTPPPTKKPAPGNLDQAPW